MEYFSYSLPKKNSVDQVLKFAEAAQGLIVYSPGQTNFATTVAQSFAMKSGVCQDHAHIMLSLCRATGIPARYVSGYFFAEESPNLASHAWIDFCSDIDQGIWTSVDITHACLIDSRHIRLAIGRDYYSAAPVKGVRSGGGGGVKSLLRTFPFNSCHSNPLRQLRDNSKKLLRGSVYDVLCWSLL